jgi:murein DD-endopeptidase MepM/ murein hydrolase activator NlpD
MAAEGGPIAGKDSGNSLAMNIILLSRFNHKKGSIDLCVPGAAAWVLALFVLSCTVLAYGGYQFGKYQALKSRDTQEVAEFKAALSEEQRLVADARADARANLDALAMRIASLQAHLMRLDAVGQRLVSLGKLDKDEFNFSDDPAVGGLTVGDGRPQEVTELAAEMQRVDQLLDDREKKLSMLEGLLANRELLRELQPSGRPVAKGWISSLYGYRTDPFTGRKALHRGMDFAGKAGSEVKAVAAGMVVRSNKDRGYGNVVEIRHADGYSTRYAHNQKNLVKPGDMVSKGQTIALLGSTGRSNGPHVHFEVRRNGRTMDPRRYLNGE